LTPGAVARADTAHLKLFLVDVGDVGIRNDGDKNYLAVILHEPGNRISKYLVPAHNQIIIPTAAASLSLIGEDPAP
jgi:hypothetical protein